MGKKGGSAVSLILIVGLLAGLLLFSGQIMTAIANIVPAITDFIGQIRGGLPGAGGNISGATWIGYTIFYVDGTSEDVRQEQPAFSFFPLSISFGSKDIQSFRVDVRAKLNSDKTMGAWNSDVSLLTEIYKKPETAPKSSSTGEYSKQGASWANGETKVLASYTVEANTLEQLVATYGEGAWQLQFKGIVKLDVMAEGVKVDLASTAPAGGMDFTYNNGIPSLSVFGDSFSISG